MASNRTSPALTRGMKITIAAVGLVIILGLVISIALTANTPSSDPAGTSTPGPSTSTGPGAGQQPDATTTPASEVPPTAAPPTDLPPLETAKPLMSAPLPDSASRSGGLAPGFPTDILGPRDGSDVISSSIATENTVMQVDLVAMTTAGPDEIRRHYSELWGSLGLQEQNAADGTLTCIGPYESITLAVETSGTGNRYTIHAVFRTE